MILPWLSAVVTVVVLTGAAGQSVNQTEGPVTLTQGDPILLKCSYQSSLSVSPFWYVQNPGQPPTVFLKDLGKDGSEEGARRGFEAQHDKNLKTFHMRKPTSQLSDSAVYFCAVSDTVRQARREAWRKHSLSVLGRAQKIDQPGSATALERTSYNLRCNLSSVTTEKVLWYQQVSGQGPRYIAGAFPGKTAESAAPESTLHFPEDKKSTTLVLHRVTLEDAAVYFCALSGTQCVREGLSRCINPTQRQRREGAEAA